MSKQLTTPAGETVEVLTDSAVADVLDVDDDRHLSQVLSWTKLRPPIIRTLWKHGTYEEGSGRATGLLAADAGLGLTQITPVLASPSGLLCVDRRTKGKRCYRIQLVAVPERWVPHLLNGHAPVVEAPAPVVEVVPHDLPPEPVIDVDQRNALVHDLVEPVAELEVAHAVALSLLTQVVEIIAGGRGDAHELEQLRRDVGDMARRLGEQTDDSQRMRRKVRELGDELAAIKYERDGLRKRAQMAEHNLKVATSGDVQRVIDSEVRKKLDQLMRQAPVRQNGDGHA